MPTTIADRERAAQTTEVKSAEELRKWAQAAKPGARVIYFHSSRARYKTNMLTGEQTALVRVDDLFKQAAKLQDQKAVMLFQRPIIGGPTERSTRFQYLAVRVNRVTHDRVRDYVKRFYCDRDVFAFLTADPLPPYRQRGKDYENTLEDFSDVA
jgi:hypothetical protein